MRLFKSGLQSPDAEVLSHANLCGAVLESIVYHMRCAVVSNYSHTRPQKSSPPMTTLQAKANWIVR